MVSFILWEHGLRRIRAQWRNKHREILRKAKANLERDLNVADILNRFPEPIFTDVDKEDIKAARKQSTQAD